MRRTNPKINILIVDDCLINQKVITATLNRVMQNSPNIMVAGDGLQAVQLCNRYAFNLIFMDFNMPIMRGDEATAEIRKGNLNPFETCCILTCSTTTKNEQGYHGIFPGANDQLDKPINEDALIKILIQYKYLDNKTQDYDPGFFYQSTQNNSLKNNGKSCCNKYCTIL